MPRLIHQKAFGSGIGFGTLIAFVLSWLANHSLGWAPVHAVYSWFYVAYYGLTKSGMIAPFSSSDIPSTSTVLIACIIAIVAFVAAVRSARQ